MHRQHHYLSAMVIVAFLLSVSAASFVGSVPLPLSSAAARSGITVTADAATTDNVVLPEQTDVIIERFLLRSGREDAVVDTLSFTNCVTSGEKDNDADCADTGESAGNDSVISAIALLYNDGENDRRTRGTLTDGVATFTNLDLVLPAGKAVPVAVRIATSAIDGTTVDSGDQFQLNVNATTAPFHATATGGGMTFTEADVRQSVPGHPRTIRNTLAVLTLSAGAPSGPVDDGWGEVFRLNATAADTGDVTIQALTFALTVTTAGGGNWNTCPFLGADEAHFALVDVATGETVPATWSAYDGAGAACTSSEDAVGYLHATLTTAATVAAGTTSTYALYIDTTYAADDDMLRVEIPSESALAEVTEAFSAVMWSDGVMSDITGDDIDSLPIVGHTVVF